jgi:hypothetical protein
MTLALDVLFCSGESLDYYTRDDAFSWGRQHPDAIVFAGGKIERQAMTLVLGRAMNGP